jgi:hypothetical protein
MMEALMGVNVRKIRFESGDSTIHYRGSDSYTIPEGHPSAVVTFEIIEPDGDGFEINVVVDSRQGRVVKDYNGLIEAAYRSLAVRLRALTGAADDIEREFPEKAESGA